MDDFIDFLTLENTEHVKCQKDEADTYTDRNAHLHVCTKLELSTHTHTHTHNMQGDTHTHTNITHTHNTQTSHMHTHTETQTSILIQGEVCPSVCSVSIMLDPSNCQRQCVCGKTLPPFSQWATWSHLLTTSRVSELLMFRAMADKKALQ